jgi:hypothetical protein
VLSLVVSTELASSAFFGFLRDLRLDDDSGVCWDALKMAVIFSPITALSSAPFPYLMVMIRERGLSRLGFGGDPRVPVEGLNFKIFFSETLAVGGGVEFSILVLAASAEGEFVSGCASVSSSRSAGVGSGTV